jgi:hypothetical protein
MDVGNLHTYEFLEGIDFEFDLVTREPEDGHRGMNSVNYRKSGNYDMAGQLTRADYIRLLLTANVQRHVKDWMS